MKILDAEEMIVALMKQHGLFQSGWKWQWYNAIHAFGECSHKEKRLIFSRVLFRLNSAAECRNTILHEIAHALTPNHAHDPVWQTKAIELGCDGQQFASEGVVNTSHNFQLICFLCSKSKFVTYLPENFQCKKCKKPCVKVIGIDGARTRNIPHKQLAAYQLFIKKGELK